MIKQITDVNALEEVTGGLVIVRSSSFTSSSSSSGAPSSFSSRGDSFFAEFFARRDAARARNAEREATQASSPSTGRRGFSPSAAIGLGSNVGI